MHSSKVFQHLEKDLFNTGPRSNGTHPREDGDVRIISDQLMDFSCPLPNEYPNIEPVSQQNSRSGDALSFDAGMEMRSTTPNCRTPVGLDRTPNFNASTPTLGTPTTGDTTPVKPKRKRKAKAPSATKGSPSVSRSPKQHRVNGDSSSNEHPPRSPSPQSFSQMNLTTYPCSSDSNLSPPRIYQTKRDVDVQTEVVMAEADTQKLEIENLKRSISNLHKQVDKLNGMHKLRTEFITKQLINDTKRERLAIKDEIIKNNARLGHSVPNMMNHNAIDHWVDGHAFLDLDKKKQEIEAIKEDIQNETTSRKKRTVGRKPNDTARDNNDGFLKPELPFHLTQEFFDRRDEILRLRKEQTKKDEIEIVAEKDKLDRERNIHAREIKRVQAEESSRFKNFDLLNKKYLPMALLGKGGFSEVWKAVDLDDCTKVACKIHHVNKEWRDSKKMSYVRHAMREKDIHKSLNHPNIVKMFDIFTIDNDSFCTVLEYCDGNDLDFHLKQHRSMPEKETRLVIGQVVDALRYLNELPVPIIHYDLKPANILLQSGYHRFEIKITDFGLSKTIENADTDNNIELTSQGAGTYWYLPPETFRECVSGNAPRISSKVDVWSVGVICFQCIYGIKPFGNDHSQQRILNEGTILNAKVVDFPTKPAVSDSVRDFIRKCLQYEPVYRADVFELSKHDFARAPNKRVL
uniref:Protein kinase domain-containing protein n=1 Tax=Panagrellus redivivus TaxID=6233 RepID=A0A7E4W4Q6_PANRE